MIGKCGVEGAGLGDDLAAFEGVRDGDEQSPGRPSQVRSLQHVRRRGIAGDDLNTFFVQTLDVQPGVSSITSNGVAVSGAAPC